MPPYCEAHQRWHVIRRDRQMGEAFTLCPECSTAAANAVSKAPEVIPPSPRTTE